MADSNESPVFRPVLRPAVLEGLADQTRHRTHNPPPRVARWLRARVQVHEPVDTAPT